MKSPFVAWHLSLVVLGAFASATGCQRSRAANGVSDEKFVTVMAALKRAQDRSGVDARQQAARRDSILQSSGLTPAQLEAAAKRLAQNPARAQEVWQAVQRRASDTSKASRPAVK